MQLLNANRYTRLDLLVIALVILIGLVHLPYPFHGDQALFTVGASKISRGALLYRDFWDLKQPGIFGFYLLAGTLFGFSEVGIHAFELFYMVVFSVVLLITLKSYFKSPAIASLVPLLTVGMYYGVSRDWHLTQVEGLVGFPMFLSLWFASQYSRRKGRGALQVFLSGFMGGLVLLFKFLFFPILISFWLTMLIDAVAQKHEQLLGALIRISVPVILGLLFPLAIMIGYFAWFDILNLLNHTFFEYPARAVAELPGHHIGFIKEGFLWWLSGFTPLTAFAFVWAYASLNKRIELLTANFGLWLVLGLCVIFLQRHSWWEYHYLLLFVPLGVLAAKGLDVLWERIKETNPSLSYGKNRMAVVLGVALLFSPILVSLVSKSLSVARAGFALRKEQRLKYQSKISEHYKTAMTEVAFLSEPDSLPGDIYICGNPVYYYLSGRNQAIAINGWSINLLLPEQWAQLTNQLAEVLPPYIFADTLNAELIFKLSPQTSRFIEENYRVLRRSDAGTWYVLQDNLQARPRPERSAEPLGKRDDHVHINKLS